MISTRGNEIVSDATVDGNWRLTSAIMFLLTPRNAACVVYVEACDSGRSVACRPANDHQRARVTRGLIAAAAKGEGLR